MYVKKFGNKLKYSIEFIGCGFQEHYTTTFKNGYGVSIIRSLYSYGGNEGLYEIAITNKSGEIIYDKFESHDVLGFLDEHEVEQVINEVKLFKSP